MAKKEIKFIASMKKPRKDKVLAYTDYPILALGDKYGEKAPTRGCEVLDYDGDKYATILVGGVIEGVKSGYVYRSYTDKRTLPKEVWKSLDNSNDAR